MMDILQGGQSMLLGHAHNEQTNAQQAKHPTQNRSWAGVTDPHRSPALGPAGHGELVLCATASERARENPSLGALHLLAANPAADR